MILGAYGIEKIETKIISSFKRDVPTNTISNKVSSSIVATSKTTKIALLLNILNHDFDYTLLKYVDKLYIPLKYFGNVKYKKLLDYFSKNFNLYIYMPTIIRKNYMSVARNILKNSFKSFNIRGIAISHISQLEILSNLSNSDFSCSKIIENLDIIANYTLNIYNNATSKFLSNLNLHCVTISPELDEDGILSICQNTCVRKELIVYGNIPVMTTNYCPLGKSNKCYKECFKKCQSNSKFYLKDRMNMLFRIIPDNSQTVSTIYNSKITSIEHNSFNLDFARIDILDEDIYTINNIIETIKLGKRLEGKDYTNGNLKREI